MLEPELPVWTQWLDVTTDDKGEPVRHRVAFGGRGASKTRSFATKLLMRGLAMSSASFAPANSSAPSATRSIASWSMKSTGLGLGVLGSGHYMVTDREIKGRERDPVHLRRASSQ
jgi:hypothetical protein